MKRPTMLCNFVLLQPIDGEYYRVYMVYRHKFEDDKYQESLKSLQQISPGHLFRNK